MFSKEEEDENRREQESELEALKYMYPDDECLTIFECLPKNIKMSKKTKTTTSTTTINTSIVSPTGLFVISPQLEEECEISWADDIYSMAFFPPIYCTFTLPFNYPSKNIPTFQLACDWLNAEVMKSVQNHIHLLTNELYGNLVLIRIFSFLHQDFMQFLWKLIVNKDLHASSTSSSSSSTTLSSPSPSSSFHWPSKISLSIFQNILPTKLASLHDLFRLFKQHDMERRQREFLINCHECMVCCGTLLGSKCIQFDACRHIFCRKCVIRSFTMAIQNGLNLDFTCLACDTLATQSQVRSLLSQEQQQRVEYLSIKSALSTMDDVMNCPRCEFPVIVDKNDNFGMCQKCEFSFCLRCKKLYHPANPCSWLVDEHDLMEYRTGTYERKKKIEEKYDKRQLLQALDELLSTEYMNENNIRCPRCQSAIEKTGGCNKMTCLKCKTYFCWLCREVLQPNNPYAHYGTRASRCFNMLFMGVVPDEGEDEEEVEYFPH